MIAPPFTDGGPHDPDRPWAWRDSGDGAEDASDDCDGCAREVCVCGQPLDEDGPIDDAISEAAARGTAFLRVTYLLT